MISCRAMASIESPRPPRRPVVGFLSERFDEAYQHAVWKGAASEAERLGTGIVFFGGRRIRSPIGSEALANVAFDLAERSGLAGLVVMANVIGTFVSPEEEAFLGRFQGRPVVTVGLSFPGMSSVAVNASGGMRSVAEHLVGRHGRRRFLFLAGPPGHPESEARQGEFLGAMAEIAPEASVEILQGDFTEDEAARKVAAFLDAAGGRPSFDAVVAANDLMAIGAMRSLAGRGVDVPREVSVTGFDDTDDSIFSVPPLTTVRQPMDELGAQAVRRIVGELGLLPGQGPGPGRSPGAVDAGPSFPVPEVAFVQRQSCGCPFGVDGEADAALGQGPAYSLDELYCRINEDIRARRNPSHLRSCRFDPASRAQALLAIAEGESRFLASWRIEAERRFASLGEIQSSLVSSFGMEEALAETARGVRELGVSACWLCLFEADGSSTEWSRLLLASENDDARILAPQGLRFRTAELVPGGLPARWSTYVCEPLCFGEDRLGYLVCTGDASDRRMYEILRDQVAGAIKGALLMAAERNRERELEIKVRERTLELSAANERLVEEISRRKALEEELLGISNRIMGDIGRDIHDNLCQDIAGLGIMSAVLEGRLRRNGDAESAEAAADLGRVAGETAARAKAMARGLYPAELEAKGGLVGAVERLVEAANAGPGRPGIRLEISKGFRVRDPEKALHLYRIVQEALSNALKHAQASSVRIGLYMDRETVSVEVVDDGIGMPACPREDSGMGLRILKYRASVIGGDLRVRALDRGTAISCRAPR